MFFLFSKLCAVCYFKLKNVVWQSFQSFSVQGSNHPFCRLVEDVNFWHFNKLHCAVLHSAALYCQYSEGFLFLGSKIYSGMLLFSFFVFDDIVFFTQNQSKAISTISEEKKKDLCTPNIEWLHIQNVKFLSDWFARCQLSSQYLD